MNGLYLNEDDSNFYKSFPDSSMTREGLEKFIRGYMRKQVGAVVLNPNAQRTAYNSHAVDPIWHGVEIVSDDEIIFQGKRQKVRPLDVKRIKHARLLHESNLNAYRVWLEVLRKEGFEGWISCRMNDVHNVYDEDNYCHDTFWREHPEYRCSQFDGTWAGYCLDFKYPEVRDYKMALIEEMLTLYDCDGLELDWLRFPRCLQPGYEREGARFVTEVVRRTREFANQKARERNHPIKINVRVPSRPDDALRCGYDVINWVREGLVDVVTVSNFWPTTDSDMPLELWRELLGEDIELNAGLDLWTCAYPEAAMIPCTDAMAAGFASEYFYRGADKIYLFNFMQGMTGMNNPEGFVKVMENCGIKETAYAQMRRHVVTYPSIRPVGTEPNCTVPRVIRPNWQPIRINVGGGTAGRTAYVVTGVEKPLEGDQKICIKFHGTDCPAAEPLPDFKFPENVAGAAYHKIPDGLLHDGDNVFHIHLTAGENRAVWSEIVIL